MKTITSKELKIKILSKFKRCAPPLIFDRVFSIPDIKFLSSVIKINSITNFPWYLELFDCNSYSLVLKSEIRKWQVQKYHKFKREDYRYPICFGSCQIEEGKGYHSINICFCEDDFLFIDPQTNEIIDVDPDQVSFVIFGN